MPVILVSDNLDGNWIPFDSQADLEDICKISGGELNGNWNVIKLRNLYDLTTF